jgi:RHS repeat-associated protein
MLASQARLGVYSSSVSLTDRHSQAELGNEPTCDYHYSGEGDLLAVIDSLAGETRYTYDADHRLITMTLPNGQSQTFSYDPAGNLLQQPGLNGIKLQGGNRLLSASGCVFDYNYRNHLSHQQRNGHTTTQYGYNSRDMLVECVLEQGEWRAQYDPLGRRVSKTFQGQTTQFYWDTDRLVAEISPKGQLRIYLYVSTLALTLFMFLEYDSMDAAPEFGQRYFIFGDHLGTPIRVENELAQTVWQARVSPYGTVEVEVGESFYMPLRFSGHYFDAEIRLHYNRFRYYDPWLGRYLQSDPDGIGGGLNLYAYAGGNPLKKWVDVRGLMCGDEEDGNNVTEGGVDKENTNKKGVVSKEHIKSLPDHPNHIEGLPFAYKEKPFRRFVERFDEEFKAAGFNDVDAFMQGSTASGFKYNNGNPIQLDSKRGIKPSDYDVAIVSPKILQKADELGMNVLNGPLTPTQIERLGLSDAQEALSKASKGELPVNFKIYKSINDVYDYDKTIPFSNWRN